MENNQIVRYIITYQPQQRDVVIDKLAAYAPVASTLVDVVSVSIPKSSEASLLECLLTIEGITYHQAKERRALSKHHPRAPESQ